jgi:hypothetical protein
MENPYRLAFLPAEFKKPLRTKYREEIAGRLTRIKVGSAPCLLRELCALAPELGIRLKDGELPYTIAMRINKFRPLSKDDDCVLIEDERTAWLLLYEGARLAVKHNVALSLAG